MTQVYKRLPINTSVYDGHVLAAVQETLIRETELSWKAHRSEPGSARTIALAAGQLVTVVSERSYLSAENDRQVKMSAGFLPAGGRTGRVLRAGVRLLSESLPELSLSEQHHAIGALGPLRGTAGGLLGPFSSKPPEDLVALAAEVIAEARGVFAALAELPLPSRSRLVDVLGGNP